MWSSHAIAKRSPALAMLIAALVAAAARGNGTETLGPPSIPIAPGTGIVAAGAGTTSGGGVIEFTVPAGASVEQVLIYWAGFGRDDSAVNGTGAALDNAPKPIARPTYARPDVTTNQPKTLDGGTDPMGSLTTQDVQYAIAAGAAIGDSNISVNGVEVTGVLIGGPTLFVNNRWGSAYRADITGLNLVVPGANTLVIDGMDYNVQNDGVGVIVIYDDGTQLVHFTLVDGHDLAFNWFTPPLNTTVAQTLTVPPAALARSAVLHLFVGDADPGRPSELRVTIGGITTIYNDLFQSADGPEWDTLALPITIPPGVASVTAQVISKTNAAGDIPASLAWITAGLVVSNGIFADCDLNSVPDVCDVSCAALNGGCANAYPAACGLAEDCNGNNRPDVCDLAGSDCNNNGIPDTCEPGGGACSDGNLCTINDACVNGVCVGTPRNCSSLNGICVVGACNPANGQCRTIPANTGGACEDGFACTIDDFCWNGACVGFERDCADLDDTCNAGLCDEQQGGCVKLPLNDGGACTDEDLCTTNEACANGVCTGDTPNCSSLNDACNTGVCNPETGNCVAEPSNEGGDCDDSDACSLNDFCSNGVCAGLAADCSFIDNACQTGACNPLTGTCDTLPANEGGLCDDGNGCTVGDACSGGACHGEPKDCSTLDHACLVGVCLGTTGICTVSPANESAPCDDGDACTRDDQCEGGICRGQAIDCSNLDDACNVGACVGTNGACAATPANEGGTCDDGDACTVNDTCAGGTCAGEPLDCSGLDDDCNIGVCDAGTGTCVRSARTDGATCDDGDACTENDLCAAGACAGTAKDCSDQGDACNIGVCVGTSGICEAQPANEGGTCDDGDACTINDVCAAGTCGGAPLDCSGLSDSCDVGVCVGTSGFCEAQPANEGGACDDGDLCTINDACANGVCAGTPLDCSTLNDSCNIGVCIDSSGLCAAQPTNEGGACDDGDLCTINDTCAGGTCAGTPRDCSAMNNACNVGVCVAATGECAAQPASEGGACDDGNLCTSNDLCAGGVCAGTPVDCSGLNDACNIGVCIDTTGVCAAQPTHEGGTCDDGDLCTTNDACANGACAGTPLDCSALNNACNVGVCVDSTGLCAAQPANEGGTCNDGNLCTTGDSCAGGACAGTPVDCSGLTDACNVGVCVDSTGLCAAQPANEGAACDDGNLCTSNDACAGGTCAGAAVDCSSLTDACNVGVCIDSTGLCAAQPANEGGTCDDGDHCTANDACASGACAGAPVDCSTLDDACNVGVCDELTGNCLIVPRDDGGTCDDGDPCTLADSCTGGVCAGVPLDCSPLDDACNIGVCDLTSGVCTTQPRTDGTLCDDGNGCTTNDACSSGFCAGEPLDCSGLNNACNLGECVGTTGVCAVVPANEGGACDDGDLCTSNDVCAGGACAGAPVDCSGLNDACNVGACVSSTGLCAVTPVNEGDDCDDGDLCTLDDTCALGVCAGTARDCSALDDACNVGECVSSTGLCAAVSVNEGGACSDDDLCTVDDICALGVCAGAPLDCSALDDACNVGECVSSTGLCAAVPINDGGGCDDGDGCTVDDNCLAGACVGAPMDCSALNDACLIGECIGTSGICTALPANEGGACDDGDGCTIADTCLAGACQGNPVDCSALDDACNVGICAGTSGLCETVPANEGGACDDGDNCTENDVCSAGGCAGTPVDCSALDDACNVGVCDALTGVCLAQPLNESGVCDDGDPCTEDDACAAGVCVGQSKDCSALSDACNVGVCNAVTGVCEAAPANEGGPCDDGDACSEGDSCVAGICGGIPKDCSNLDNDCNIGTCIGTSGLCVAVPANEGAACSDGINCTIGDSCVGGTCTGVDMPCGLGMACDEDRAECVQLPAGRASTSQKGSLLIYPKVELRWDAAGQVVQDTYLSLVNDHPDSVFVQMYFVNGDLPTSAVYSGGNLVERAHPGWNWVDVGIALTGNQPTYWSALNGTPGAGGVSPLTVLDPGAPPGRPDPEHPGQRLLRGYVVAYAVDSLGREIRWNHLSGSAMLVNYADGTAWEYRTYGFQIVNPAIPHGAQSGTPGELHLNGLEYDSGFDLLVFNFQATGTQFANGAPLGPGATGIPHDTDLTLMPLTMDLRQETGGPVTTKASFTIWNQNEVKFTGLDRCVTCWDQHLFTAYGVPNHFLRVNLQTDAGWARVDGLASQVCDRNFDPGDGLPLGADPRDVVSEAAALVGVVARQMCFRPDACDAAGETLGGIGTQNGLILVDHLGSPPPERPEVQN